MSDPVTLALTILALLLGAAVVTALMSGSAAAKKFAHMPIIVACGASALLAIILVTKVAHPDPLPAVRMATPYPKPLTWFSAGNFTATVSLTVDPLAAIMLAMITFIATFIAVFSSGYMRDEHHHPDAGYVRYFAVMSLFVFCMCGLVLANNFLLLVGFWEGVGLCSYLLVGYYYEKPSAAAAARKAFLVTRLGDTGLLLGIMLLWKMTSSTDLDYVVGFVTKEGRFLPSWELTAACLLLFCGAVGKSAQFPLYVWLPDAMEGPTPVSALIHAATMVTAGVYLVARCAPLFALSPDAQVVVAWTGGITALLAAFIALAQTDLKRVLAYSTVSQLGFMFLALGTVGAVSPVFAVVAAMFHLFTHAFFKALLFLASGSVMHAMGGVIDMRRFGGLRKVMPTTHLTFLCGAAALAGLPLLSGFWSKDLILESLQFAAQSPHPYAQTFYGLMLLAMLTAALTAFYTFRAYFLTFWGPTVIPDEAGHHAHESPAVMTVPLMVLAVGALFVGIVAEPFTHYFSDFVGRTPSLRNAARFSGTAAVEHHFNWGVAGVSTLLAVGGVALAYMAYGAGGPERVPVPLAGVFALSRNKLYVDEAYHAALVKPAEWLAVMARVFDLLLDSISRVIAAVPRLVGVAVRPIQNGLVQFYALSMALGLVVFLSFVVFRAGR